MEQGLWSLESLEHITQWGIVLVAIHAFGESEIEDRVQPEKHRPLAIAG